MTVGSDSFEAAPNLPVGTASDWTPNSTYTMQPGEPGGSAGRTAWWKFTPAEAGVHYIDALHSRFADGSLAPTWLWIYKGTSLGTLIEQTWTGNRAQIDVTPGTTYYVQVDARQADSQVWYCLAVGAHPSAELVQRHGLGGPWLPPQTDTQPDDIADHHFRGTADIQGAPGTPGEAWEDAANGYLNQYSNLIGGTTTGRGVVHGYAVNDNDSLDQEADSTYAWFDQGAYDAAVKQAYADTHGLPYDSSIDHGILLVTSSAYREPIETPDSYSVSNVRLIVRMRAEPGGQVIPIQTDPSTGDAGRIRAYSGHALNDGASSLGAIASTSGQDLTVTSSFQDFLLNRPAGLGPEQVVDLYNNDSFILSITPGWWGQSNPSGGWYFSYVGLEVTFASTDEYFPPDPPPFPTIAVTRLYPRDDGRGLSSAARIHPPTKARRIVGGYQ